MELLQPHTPYGTPPNLKSALRFSGSSVLPAYPGFMVMKMPTLKDRLISSPRKLNDCFFDFMASWMHFTCVSSSGFNSSCFVDLCSCCFLCFVLSFYFYCLSSLLLFILFIIVCFIFYFLFYFSNIIHLFLILFQFIIKIFKNFLK